MNGNRGGVFVLNLSGVGTAFCIACAAVGTWFSQLYGGWDAGLSVLLLLVIGDYVTGLIASIMDGTGLSSKVGAKGIAKKVMILFLVLVAHRLDQALGLHVMMLMVVYFYVTNELISLTENIGRMGVAIPAQLVDIVAALKGSARIIDDREERERDHDSNDRS